MTSRLVRFGLAPCLLLFVLFAPLHAEDAPAAPAATETGPAPGHSVHGEAFNEGPRQAARLMEGTGACHLPVTSGNPEVQPFFDQGVGQLHGFWYFEAERSFRQAAKLDPMCAMAYWGMAMANINNEKRAKTFIKKASELKGSASERERKWIDALAAYYADGDKDNKDRRRDLVRAYENLVHAFPDELEAKAFLAVLIWQNSSNGLPITSHEAVAALIREVLATQPMHPVHHYHIHLWDGEKSEWAIPSAARCGQSAPAIAHMWHMPGHTFSSLKRYDDAAWQQEASNRVDHAYMIRDGVLPDQIHNYAHNSEWLIRDLLFVGRVQDATRLAKYMLESPRHPKLNALDKGGTSASLGRERLYQILTRYERWNDLIDLSSSMYLPITEDQGEKVKRLRALGVAHSELKNADDVAQCIAELEELLVNEKVAQQKAVDEAVKKAVEEKQPAEKVTEARNNARNGFNGRLEPIEKALFELWGRQSLEAGATQLGLSLLERGDIPRDRLARHYLAAGENDRAVELANADVNDNANQVQPLANQVAVLHAAGKAADAGEAFQKLRAISAQIDLDQPVFARLAPLAQELGLPEDWRLPATKREDSGERPELASLGPFTWRPSPAPSFTLTAPDGRSVSLADYRGKPVVLVFYLGFGCVHCVEQLNKFAPLTEKFKQQGIELLAISTDAEVDLEKSLAACQTEGGFPFPLLSDSRYDVFRTFRVFDDFEDAPLHATFLIDGAGLIRWQDISYEPFTDAEFLLKESQRLLAIPVDVTSE